VRAAQAAPAAPFVTVSQTLDQKLLSQTWPTADRADIHALVAADGAIIVQLDYRWPRVSPQTYMPYV